MLTRQYVYADGAVSIPEGSFDSLVLQNVSSDCMVIFLAKVAQRYPEDNIVMVLMEPVGIKSIHAYIRQHPSTEPASIHARTQSG